MHQPPRKSRFQIHLSTAIALMFAAGGLIWANTLHLREHFKTANERRSAFNGKLYSEAVRLFQTNTSRDYMTGQCVSSFGWPMHAMTSERGVCIERDRIHDRSLPEPLYSFKGFAVDGVVALSILGAVWFIAETVIRRAK